MNLEIVKPDENLFSGDVKSVHLPGSDGSFELLDNHAPLIATLKEGSIKVTTDSKTETFEVKGGVVEVNNNKVIVLAE
ncbi:ATP synthase F1 subunit epsilon [Flavobacteriales bacterium]|jgi:F-type H+-transporting ATPase subunit epsilon|nr:ATP synthase F1 subunit epsilon [Flavobacteriales bacterium]